jgi:hypothetical protein
MQYVWWSIPMPAARLHEGSVYRVHSHLIITQFTAEPKITSGTIKTNCMAVMASGTLIIITQYQKSTYSMPPIRSLMFLNCCWTIYQQ